jgi:DNA-binding transcriptional regulator YiaG
VSLPVNNTEIVQLALARRYALSGAGGRVRRAARLSLQEVADACGSSVTTVWRWEQGQRVPRGAPATAWVRLLIELKEAAMQELGA